MPGMDNVQINVRERPLSTDINDLQSMVGRNVMDILRYALAQEETPVAPGIPSSTPQNVVLGGLVVTPSGTDLSVSPGALLQDSATVPVAPGALDSNYRVGVIRSAATVPTVVPGSDTYYLLQAQVSRVVTVSASRDVMNLSGNFVPTLVDKQIEFRIDFNLKAGTGTQIPAADADWVPIAGLLRPSAGGAITNDQIFDMRPKWSTAIRATQTDSEGHVESYASAMPQPHEVSFDYAAWVRGRRLFAKTNVAIDFHDTQWLSPGTSAVASLDTRRFNYVYLVAPRGRLYKNGYAGVTSNCLVVISATVKPDINGVNSAALPLPAPFSGVSAAAGEAVLVNVLLNNSVSGNNFNSWEYARNGINRIESTTISSSHGVGNLVCTAGSVTPIDFDSDTGNPSGGGTEVLPHGVSTMIGFAMVSNTVSSDDIGLLLFPTLAGSPSSGLGTNLRTDKSGSDLGTVLLATRTNRGTWRFSGTGAGTYTANVSYEGWVH